MYGKKLLMALILLASTTILSAQQQKVSSAIQETTPLSKDYNKIPFVFLNAGDLQELVRDIQVTGETKDIVKSPGLPYTIRLYFEKQKSQKEFEIHEFRNHYVQVMTGTTQFEIGGDPLDARILENGERLAQNVKGSKLVTLGVGDVLVIPMGTPHRRITTESAVYLMTTIVAPKPVPTK